LQVSGHECSLEWERITAEGLDLPQGGRSASRPWLTLHDRAVGNPSAREAGRALSG
jgi:hypothetical protein